MNLGPKPGENEPTGLRTEEQVAEEAYLRVLDLCIGVMAASGRPHAFIGGLATQVYGRDRSTNDIDVFVRVEDAPAVLEGFAAAGFETEPTNPDWLYKATRERVLVDVIFRASDGTEFDAGTRVDWRPFKERTIPFLGPEDLLLVKLPAFNEATPRHWWDCLAILEGSRLDWDHLVRRAARRPHRLLSLLDFARGEGIAVPEAALAVLRQAALSSAA